MAAVEVQVVLGHRPSPQREGRRREGEGVSTAAVAVAVMRSGSPLALLQVLRVLSSAL